MTAFVLTAVGTIHAAGQTGAPTRSVVEESAFVGRTVVDGLLSPLEWKGRDWLRFGGSVAALATISLADGTVRDLARRNQGSTGDELARVVKPFGRAGSAIIVGAFLTGGLVLDDARARATAIDAIAASVLTSALIVPMLQSTIGRSRPWRDDGVYAFKPFGGGHSFPSGHAGQAFAIATVIAEHYDGGWIDAVAYGGATLVAASRVYHDAHYLSDVAASAVIATLVGRTIVKHGLSERSVPIQPAVGIGTIGFKVAF
jgi:membrane-associated phospholipid phosphatase